MPSLDDASLAALDVPISKAHEHLAILRRIRNSFVSPLCRMPYEIIVNIISFVPDPNEDGNYVPLIFAETSLICHRIWSILKDSPKFWGRVEFGHPDSQTFIARCQGRPTCLWIRCGPSEGRNRRINAALYRWRTIPTFSVETLEEFRFYGTQGDFDKFAWVFTKPLPRLNTLVVASGRIQFDLVQEITETWTIVAQFPAGLRSVILKQVSIPWTTCLTAHLVNLDLDYSQTEELPITMSSFVELLALCVRLETLRLNCAGPETQDENLAHVRSNDPVYLTNLRVFEIFDDALNIAYIMNHLKLPDTARIRVEPSIDWPEQLVNFTLPRETRISPIEGLIKWNAGRESTLSMGATKFVYQTDAQDAEFMETFRVTFHFPFVEFAEFSTCALTVLEFSFDLEFEPDQEVWSTVLAALPALRRLSCTSRSTTSRHFAPKFFAELGIGRLGSFHCPKLEELNLSEFELHDIGDAGLIHNILRVLHERSRAGIQIRKLSVRHKSSKSSTFDSLRNWRSYAEEVELPKTVDEEMLKF
jgi:hypothetical protein